MKKIRPILILILAFIITGCGNTKELEGYWCNYEEKAIITLLVDNKATDKQKEDILDTINTITTLEDYDLVTASELASSGDANPEEMYDTYFIYLTSSDYIDDNLLLLQSTKGVESATKSIIKSNLSLYNLKNKEFKYQNDLDEDVTILEGKYKVKDNQIKFDNSDVPTIYIKDDFLCLDKSCNKILIETNSTCEAN